MKKKSGVPVAAAPKGLIYPRRLSKSSESNNGTEADTYRRPIPQELLRYPSIDPLSGVVQLDPRVCVTGGKAI